MEKIKLTKLAECAGCGAKVGAGTLASLLSDLPAFPNDRLLVGYDNSDDAAVYKITDDVAMVQTIDYFPPIVDDPYTFGQIAAANAISDVYAMGGKPKLALNVLCVAKEMPNKTVREILKGGFEKASEAGVTIAGGHSIFDREPKYGLAVTGFVHPDKVLRNNAAQEGDVLILTKALGTGILTTAHKAEFAPQKAYEQAVKQMTQLNRTAMEIMAHYRVHSCTDVTGFSLLGHAVEMCCGRVTAVLDSKAVPILDGVKELAEIGFLPEGMYRNRHFAEPYVSASPNISQATLDIFYDPQTSGGLLIAVDKEDAQTLFAHLHDNLSIVAVIGTVESAHTDCSVLVL